MVQPCVLLLSMSLDLGGAETHVISLAKALQKKGMRVLVASNGGRLAPELNKAGIPHFQVALHARRPLGILQSTLAVTRIVREHQVDLMHAHARIPAWVGNIVSGRTGVPLVTTYHGMYNPHWFLRMFTIAGVETIAVSQDVKNHLVDRFGIPKSQVTVISNGIDQSEFTYHPAADVSHLLYVSRLSDQRGGTALTLMQAVATLAVSYPNLTLQVVGGGNRLAEVQHLAERLNRDLGRQVFNVLGSRTDVAELMAEAGLVVGVGRVALEAIVSGKPLIIASEYGTYGQLTADRLEFAEGHNFSGRGAASATEPSALARQISQVLDNPPGAQEQAKVIRQLALERYSIDAVVRQVLCVYAKALPIFRDTVTKC
jgi:glycosyltransferase involved in cell wall biosynthesis